MSLRLPDGFQPIEDVSICSNFFEDVVVPFIFRESPILLLGKGEILDVWLSAAVDSDGENWRYIVERGEATHSAVSVNFEESSVGSIVDINVFGSRVLSIKYVLNLQANVTYLDFRPIGLNVFGNETSLTIGGAIFSGNRFQGATVGFSLG